MTFKWNARVPLCLKNIFQLERWHPGHDALYLKEKKELLQRKWKGPLCQSHEGKAVFQWEIISKWLKKH